MKKIKYKILQEPKLIIRYFEGQITILDLYESVNGSASDGEYNSGFSALYDFRNAEFVVDYEEIALIATKVRNNDKILNKRKLILLTNTPNQAVFASLMQEIRKTQVIDMELFSTIEACLQYLNLEDSFSKEIITELDNLKNE